LGLMQMARLLKCGIIRQGINQTQSALGVSERYTQDVHIFRHLCYTVHMTKERALFTKSLRVKHGFSQIIVADKLGISRTSYIAVENGTRELSLDEAQTLAQLYGVSLNEFSSSVVPNYEKYKQMLLAFLRASPDTRGKVPKTKLAKLLYLADFAWFYNHLESMSGMQYRRIQFGPVPDHYFLAVDELFESGKISIDKEGEAFMIAPTGSSPTTSLDLLSKEETGLISEIAKKWRGKRTQEIVDFTHHQLPYRIAAENEIIPYSLITQEDPDHVF